jgi:hypothetical protein
VENGELKKKVVEAKRMLEKASDERVFLSDQIRRLNSSRTRGTVDLEYVICHIRQYPCFHPASHSYQSRPINIVMLSCHSYLKNVIVRYLQFENYPQQRKALVPVIATILQFNAQDHEAVNKGATSGTLWSKMTGVFYGEAVNPGESLSNPNIIPNVGITIQSMRAISDL